MEIIERDLLVLLRLLHPETIAQLVSWHIFPSYSSAARRVLKLSRMGLLMPKKAQRDSRSRGRPQETYLTVRNAFTALIGDERQFPQEWFDRLVAGGNLAPDWESTLKKEGIPWLAIEARGEGYNRPANPGTFSA